MKQLQRKVVLLDRDGTINIDHGYVTHRGQFKLIPKVPEALTRLRDLGFEFAVVTNQGGIARGLYTEKDLHDIHQHMIELLEPFGVRFLKIYYCPHHQDGVVAPYVRVCNCRKPEPGMILQAIAEQSIDVTNAFMVGDKLTDVRAAQAANIHAVLLAKEEPPHHEMGSINRERLLVTESLFDFSLWCQSQGERK